MIYFTSLFQLQLDKYSEYFSGGFNPFKQYLLLSSSSTTTHELLRLVVNKDDLKCVAY